MPAHAPTIYLIAGWNGAGKTMFAKEFLPMEVKCLRYLNADGRSLPAIRLAISGENDIESVRQLTGV